MQQAFLAPHLGQWKALLLWGMLRSVSAAQSFHLLVLTKYNTSVCCGALLYFCLLVQMLINAKEI